MCGLVGIYYMGLGNFDYSFGGKKVVLLYVVHFFLILFVFYNRFKSLLATLSGCRWEGKCILFFVCCVLGVCVVI